MDEGHLFRFDKLVQREGPLLRIADFYERTSPAEAEIATVFSFGIDPQYNPAWAETSPNAGDCSMDLARDLSIIGNLASIASLYFCMPVGVFAWVILAVRTRGMKRGLSFGAIAVLALIYLGDIGVHRGWFAESAQGPVVNAITPTNAPSSGGSRATPTTSLIPIEPAKAPAPASAVTITVHEPCPSPVPTPHEITLDDGLNFISNFRTLESAVKLKVTAPAENIALRNRLVQLFTFPNSLLPITAFDRSLAKDPKYLGYMSFADGVPIVSGMMGLGRITRFAGFSIMDDDQDSGRLAAKQAEAWQEKLQSRPPDIDATPVPPPSPQSTPGAEFPKDQIVVRGTNPKVVHGVATLLQGLGLEVVTGSKIPADASAYAGLDLVYVQIGHGSLWKP